MNTCYALATARGKAGVAVIRVSGDDVARVSSILIGDLPEPHRAAVRRICDEKHELVDEALVLYFPKGQSFTGEPTVELQTHGSIAVVDAVLRLLSKIDGFRPAEPGEFTRRALLNGRLDMTQVEGLADLVEAETEAQRQQALRVFTGELSQKTADWRSSLIRAAALIEATIDFADEEVPVDVSPEVKELLDHVVKDINTQLAGYSAAERIRDGFEVAILGVPNSGKSTLLNAIAQRDAALVSDVAGTTRDIIEVRMDLNGLPVTFLDTAGIRDTDDRVEALGIERALERAKSADIRVFLKLSNEDLPFEPQDHDLVLKAKSDMSDSTEGVSGKTGAGISDLLNTVSEYLSQKSSLSGVATKERHRIALENAASILDGVLNRMFSDSSDDELLAEDLRSCLRVLDVLIGRVDVENVLDEIFASFCLGK